MLIGIAIGLFLGGSLGALVMGLLAAPHTSKPLTPADLQRYEHTEE